MHIGHKQGAGRLHGQQEVTPGSPRGMLGDVAALQVLLQVFVLLLVQAAPKYEHLQSAAASRRLLIPFVQHQEKVRLYEQCCAWLVENRR